MQSEETDDLVGVGHLQDLQIDSDKIKGDAIGDTVYSERFVLRLLMKLSQFEEDHWNEELESDLCILWDMTATKAVVTFLMHHNSLELFIGIVQSTSNPRLMEILIGMVGNMCCVKDVRDTLANHEDIQNTLLSLLSNPDSQTLVQLMRLFECIAWDLLKPESSELITSDKHWFESHLETGQFAIHIAFILSSSTSEELLNGVLVFLNTICSLNINDKDFSQYFANPDLQVVSAMLECWTQLFSSCLYENEFEFPNKQLEKSANNWVSVLLAFTGHEKGRLCLGMFAEQINEVLLIWIEIPKDGSETLLSSVIWLLEGIVAYNFSLLAFTKTLRAVYRIITIKSNRSQDESDLIAGSSEIEKSAIKEGFTSYCLAVKKHVPKDVLKKALESCKSKYVSLFWSALNEEELDSISL